MMYWSHQEARCRCWVKMPPKDCNPYPAPIGHSSPLSWGPRHLAAETRHVPCALYKLLTCRIFDHNEILVYDLKFGMVCSTANKTRTKSKIWQSSLSWSLGLGIHSSIIWFNLWRKAKVDEFKATLRKEQGFGILSVPSKLTFLGQRMSVDA